MTSHMTYYPWGGLGQFFLAENESHIYPNMCAKFGCGPTVVSRKKMGIQTDRQRKLQLYIVDTTEVGYLTHFNCKVRYFFEYDEC